MHNGGMHVLASLTGRNDKAKTRDPLASGIPATVESGGSDVVGTTCTYFRCIAAEHLAICYYCHQPGCPNHRVLIAGYRSEKTSASASGAFPRIS